MAENKSKKNLKSFTDVFGDGEFHSDLPKVPFIDTLDKTWILEDAKILKDFNGEFGVHDAGLFLFVDPENEADRFTTINSGQVVVERLKRAIQERRLPMLCTPIKLTERRNEYYNLK